MGKAGSVKGLLGIATRSATGSASRSATGVSSPLTTGAGGSGLAIILIRHMRGVFGCVQGVATGCSYRSYQGSATLPNDRTPPGGGVEGCSELFPYIKGYGRCYARGY